MKLNEYTSGVGDKIEGNLIKDVLILGPDSKNHRNYTKACMRKAVNLYENAKVYTNHDRTGQPRLIEDRIGKIVNVHVADDGIRGDMQFMDSHPLSDRIKEDVNSKLNYFGLSHSVDGKAKRTKDGVTVHEISKIYSVDVVSDSATTSNLFEENEENEKIIDEDIEQQEDEKVEENVEKVEDKNPLETGILEVVRDENIENADKLDKISEILGVIKEEVVVDESETVKLTEELETIKSAFESYKKSVEDNTYLKPVTQTVEPAKQRSLKEIASWIKTGE